MSQLNWAMIPDGGAFESLVHAILFAVDPQTVLFGRPGPDSGQDARSGDGTTITKILPPVSRFNKDNGHAVKKQTVLDKLGAFFERFFGLV